MAERVVCQVRKDCDGDVAALCNPLELWSPRQKKSAIADIESGMHRYYVSWSDGDKTEIKVVEGPGGKYLRTDRNGNGRNNLDDLPGCWTF